MAQQHNQDISLSQNYYKKQVTTPAGKEVQLPSIDQNQTFSSINQPMNIRHDGTLSSQMGEEFENVTANTPMRDETMSEFGRKPFQISKLIDNDNRLDSGSLAPSQ